MDTVSLDLFAIPVNTINLGEESRTMNSRIMEAINIEKTTDNRQHRTGVDVWQSAANLEKRYDIFKELQTTFFECFRPYLRKVGYVNCNLEDHFVCESFWANYNNSPHAFHMPHGHGTGESLFSGVYYPTSGYINGQSISLNQNLNDDVIMSASSQPPPGSLVLLDPAAAIKTQVYKSEILNRYPYYGMEICITPREGTMVLFPQYLQHLVTPTGKENFERYSIAFDINKK